MRVICCYTKQEEYSAAALEKYAPEVELIDTSGSIYAYNEAIASRWDGSDGLVVIEGDKEISSDTLPSFAACPDLWCSYSYRVYAEPHSIEVAIGLGCVRYSAEVQRIAEVSEFLCEDDALWPMCHDCGGKGCWRHLDARIAKAIRAHGVDVHVHGQIQHHHDYPNSLDALTVRRLGNLEAIGTLRLPEEQAFIDGQYAGPYWTRKEE